MSSCWQYKAFDKDQKIHEGIIEADNFVMVAVLLRQRGLQVMTATRTSNALAERRLMAMKRRMGYADAGGESTNKKSLIRRLIAKISAIFKRM